MIPSFGDATAAARRIQKPRSLLTKHAQDSVLTDARTLAAFVLAGQDTERLRLTDEESVALTRVLNRLDATDPCLICREWPEHAETCPLAAGALDRLIGRGSEGGV